MTDIHDLIDIDTAARRLGVTRHAVARALQRGTLRGTKIGAGHRSVWVTTREEVERYDVMRKVKGGSKI